MTNFISKVFIIYIRLFSNIVFFSIRSHTKTMIDKKTKMYEAKLEKLKAYYLDEIRERDAKLQVICLYYNYLIIY